MKEETKKEITMLMSRYVLCNVVEMWELNEFKISTKTDTDGENMKEMVFKMSYKTCAPVYVHIVDRYSLFFAANCPKSLLYMS